MANNSSSCPKLKLNSGYEIPLVGLGTFDSNNQEKMTDLLRESFSKLEKLKNDKIKIKLKNKDFKYIK
jgi:diketogulonate reductase-like aldo/keto reductase